MFHENHQRYLLSQFRSIDKLLSEAAANLRPGDDGRLFPTHVPDTTSDQRQVLSDYVAQLRFLLRRFLQAQNLTDSHQPVGALWSFRVAVDFVGIAVEEFRPHYLRGYGEVDAESAAAIERLVADLKSLLGRMANYLDSGEGTGISARLAQLDATVDGIGLLRELDRVIAAHGLIELRALLEQLVERAASPRFDVAVFGRVNSGKTSLLNWWLGQPLLPIGVTPMTAVPTHIVRGEVPRARVTIAASPTYDIPLDQLPDYITEDGNPANAKRVLHIEVRVPEPRLVDGLCLVDTPGLGSLASVGAAQTLEYLPRCDLGVLLIEAGGVVGREDVDVARAILDGGGELVIALSKADRLSNTELLRALAYTREQLSTELHFSVEVRAISTLPTQVALAETWFQHEFASRFAAHREQSVAALRRKTGVLREAVVALLGARLTSKSKMNSTESGPGAPPVVELDSLSQARAEIERRRRELNSIGLEVQSQIDRIIDAAADALIRGWATPSTDVYAIRAQVQAAIACSATEATHGLAAQLKQLRQQLQNSLRESGIGPSTTLDLPLPRGRPLLATDAISLPANLRRPRGLSALRPLMHAEAQSRVLRHSRASLKRQLAFYGDALRHWGSAYLDDLASQFDSAFALREGAERIGATAAVSNEDTIELQKDLLRLQRWSKDRPPLNEK